MPATTLVTQQASLALTQAMANLPYWGADKLLHYAPAATPRFDYDPATGTPRGFLREQAFTNIVKWSSDLTNAAWAPGGLNPVTATTGPDGLPNSAFLLTETTASSQHYQLQNTSGVAVGQPSVITVMVKAAGRHIFHLTAGIGFASQVTEAEFDLTAVTATNSTGTQRAQSNPTIKSVGNGWYACSIFSLLSTTAGFSLSLNLRAASDLPGTAATYTGDGSSGIIVFQPQAGAGVHVPKPLSTGATAAARAADQLSDPRAATSAIIQGSGTLFVQALTPSTAPSAREFVLELNDGTASNRIGIKRNADRSCGVHVVAGGVVQTAGTLESSGFWDVSAVGKIAVSYGSGTVTLAANGSILAAASGLTIPAGLNNLQLGGTQDATDSAGFNGWFQKWSYLPLAAINSDLVQLTA